MNTDTYAIHNRSVLTGHEVGEHDKQVHRQCPACLDWLARLYGRETAR